MLRAAGTQASSLRDGDGDTITGVDAAQTHHKVRLAGIDAPERSQPCGQDARLALHARVLHQEVSARCSKVDRYHREVCTLVRDGTDLNLALLQAGLAWHYRAYAREQAPTDAQAYAEAEQQARRAQRGLWAGPEPVPPWQWRKDRAGAAHSTSSALKSLTLVNVGPVTTRSPSASK
ncbi:MAG: hypothetical protein RL375_3578 [Pseudomonadota bacterium]